MRIETELMVRITERSTGRVINSKGYLNEYHEPTENVTAADGSEVYDDEFAPYLHSAHDLPKKVYGGNWFKPERSLPDCIAEIIPDETDRQRLISAPHDFEWVFAILFDS